MEEVYTVTEVAQALKVSESLIYTLVRRRHLPAIKLGSSVRILHSDLEQFIQDSKSVLK